MPSAEPTSTPPPRTRAHRAERWVGLFVGLAILLLLAGFLAYVRHTAIRTGWFLQKVPYYIYVEDATGLNLGDPVKMMGFDIGRIKTVLPMPPTFWFMTNRYNVFIQFEVIEPNYGYIWSDSTVKVNPVDLLGNRQIEVVKGVTGEVTLIEHDGKVVQILSDRRDGQYVDLTSESKGVWLSTEEAPAVTERVSKVIRIVEAALPAITNRLEATFSGTLEVLSNLNQLSRSMQPAAVNLAEITERLRDPDGSLGRWLFSTNLEPQVRATLGTAQDTLASANTNLAAVAAQLAPTLDSLAQITSNLNAQVQANTNLLSEVAQSVRATDQLIQGLRQHWFLKGAFKKSTNAPAQTKTPNPRADSPP